MPYRVYLKKGEEKRVLAGHSWVYANEAAKIEGKDGNGSLAEVYAADGRFIGKGYINHLSKILVRIFIRGSEQDGPQLWRERIAAAYQTRKKLFSESEHNCYRLLFAEADDMPALIIDRYGDYFVLQCLSLGVDKRKEWAAEALANLFSPKGIYLRGDVAVRQKEGLPLENAVLYGDVPDKIIVRENGLQRDGLAPDVRRDGGRPDIAFQNFIVCGSVDAPAVVRFKHFRVMLEGEVVGDVLGIDVRGRAVVFAPAGIVQNEFRRSQLLSERVESVNLGLVPGIVHLVADAEDRHGGMVPVAEDGFAPGFVVHREFLLAAFGIIFIGKSDFHVDQKPFLVRGLDELLRRDRAVEAHEIESVFLRLTDVFDGRVLERAAGHVRVFMGDDAPDVAAQIATLSVEQNVGIGEGFQFAEAEPFGNGPGLEQIKHR